MSAPVVLEDTSVILDDCTTDISNFSPQLRALPSVPTHGIQDLPLTAHHPVSIHEPVAAIREHPATWVIHPEQLATLPGDGAPIDKRVYITRKIEADSPILPLGIAGVSMDYELQVAMNYTAPIPGDESSRYKEMKDTLTPVAKERMRALAATPSDASNPAHGLLLRAVVWNDVDAAMRCVEGYTESSTRCALVNVSNKDGERPASLAAKMGLYRMLQLLIEHGADVNHFSAGGTTALHEACWEHEEESTRVLLAARADPTLLSRAERVLGVNALHLACKRNAARCIKWLLQADPQLGRSCTAADNAPPFYYAVRAAVNMSRSRHQLSAAPSSCSPLGCSLF